MKQYQFLLIVLLAIVFIASCDNRNVTEPVLDKISSNIFYKIEYTEGNYVYIFQSDGISWIDDGGETELLSGSLIKIQKQSFVRFMFKTKLASSVWNFEELTKGGEIKYNINENMYEFRNAGTYLLEIERAESDTFRVQIRVMDEI